VHFVSRESGPKNRGQSAETLRPSLCRAKKIRKGLNWLGFLASFGNPEIRATVSLQGRCGGGRPPASGSFHSLPIAATLRRAHRGYFDGGVTSRFDSLSASIS